MQELELVQTHQLPETPPLLEKPQLRSTTDSEVESTRNTTVSEVEASTTLKKNTKSITVSVDTTTQMLTPRLLEMQLDRLIATAKPPQQLRAPP